MKVVVLGASGFVGAAVVEALNRSAITVMPVAAPRIVAGPTTPELWLAGKSAAAVLSKLERALAGADAVVNCAGLATPGAQASTAMYGANALLPAVVYEAARRAGVVRMVHISSAAVQGDRTVLDESDCWTPCTPYGGTKSDGERFLLSSARLGPAVTILRPTSVHGPGRATSASLARLARSRFSSVAGLGHRHTPQVLVQNVGHSVAILTSQTAAPPIVLQPSERHTTLSVLEVLGLGRRPKQVPERAARAVIASARFSKRSAHITAARRRLAMLWFGQEQIPGWLCENGFDPAVGRVGWEDLAVALSDRESSTARRGQKRETR